MGFFIETLLCSKTMSIILISFVRSKKNPLDALIELCTLKFQKSPAELGTTIQRQRLEKPL